MEPLKCARCGHEFDRERYLLRHFDRTRRCRPVLRDIACDVLRERFFAAKAGVPPDPLPACLARPSAPDLAAHLEEIRLEFRTELLEIKSEISAIARAISQLSAMQNYELGSTTETSEEETRGQPNLENEKRRIFGQEWVAHLSDTIQTLTMFATRNIVGYVESVYLDPCHSENGTVRWVGGALKVWMGDEAQWHQMDEGDVLETIIVGAAEFLRRQGQKKKNKDLLESLKINAPFPYDETIRFYSAIEIGMDKVTMPIYADEIRQLFLSHQSI